MSEVSGPSLIESLDRYKRYERKLKDFLKPNEEILNKLSNSQHVLSSKNSANQNNFPNGGIILNLNNNVQFYYIATKTFFRY